MKSVITIRCPICYLIPKIFNSKYNPYTEPSFAFKILCPNNHINYIYNKKVSTKIKFSLTDIPCTICNLKNKSQYYCKECYAILCEICKKNHIINLNHKDIRTINEIDNICLIHNEKLILYCKTCEKEICKECINSKVHKGHEINELKTLNINKLKTNIYKYKKNFHKNLEKNKNSDIKYSKSHVSNYLSISQIEKKYKFISDNISIYINTIIDLINDYELYIKYYNIQSYNLYKNINLIHKCNNSANYEPIYCDNYEKNLNKIYNYNYKYYDSYIFKSICEEGPKIYCGLYKDEDRDLIYVYYNVDKKTLYFFNLEIWNFKKEIKLETEEKILYTFKSSTQLQFFKYKNTELFLIYLLDENIISIYDITNGNKCKKIFFWKLNSGSSNDSNSGKVYVYTERINNKALIYFFYDNEIYIFNINNQLKLKLRINEKINLNSIYFFKMKNLGKMLFISNNNEGIIYNLNNFKIYKTIEIRSIMQVIIEDIFDKKCLIIMCYDNLLYIIDFFTHEKIYKYNYKNYYCTPNYCMLLMNYNIFIMYNASDLGNCSNEIETINLITDEQEVEIKTFYRDNRYSPYQLKKIKLKNFGECLLDFPKEQNNHENKIGLFYFNKNVNKDIYEEIQKKDVLEKKISLDDFIRSFEDKINNLEKKIKNTKNRYLNNEELLNKLKDLKKNFNINDKIKELNIYKIEIYKRRKDEFKFYEKKIDEFVKDISAYKNDLKLIEETIEDSIKKKNLEKKEDIKCNYDVDFFDGLDHLF